ncbi:MAG: hypothetical protein L2C94_004265 [Aigarchaeota archaeon]|nr:hypothetical protein [Candidatus Wolframiiraptor gerlachensis]
MDDLDMLVNKRLIMLAITALVLAFLVNQAINLAQISIRPSLRAGEGKTLSMQSITTETAPRKAAEAAARPEEVLTEAGEGLGPELEVPSLLMNILFSVIVAAAAFLLIRCTKLKS